MVARTDLRPTRADDSLKKLLNKVANPQTTPHGVKVAQPGEYVDFYDTTGVSHRWDGDAIAEYDKRIAEGAAAVTAAQESLAETESTLAAAGARIAQVEQDTTPTAIGDTAAAQINERRLIIGRDAILTGTVDVAQLNVTGDMAAQIVSAMSVATKKLVVTEDAILNRATVVQSLVTPELIADRINVNSLGARLVTSGAIQTDPASNRGIKISNAGIKAWDDAGNQTINLDGKNNQVVGEFATGRYGQPRVRVFNRYNPAFTMTETLIDMQASGIGGITSYDNAVVRLSASGRFGFGIALGNKAAGINNFSIDPLGSIIMNGDTYVGGALSTKGITANGDVSVLSNFSVKGKMNISGGMSFGWFTGTSLGANQWVDAEIPLNTTMSGNSPKIFTNVKSANCVPVLCSVWGVSATKFNVRIYNLSPSTATGAMTGEWMAVVAND